MYSFTVLIFFESFYNMNCLLNLFVCMLLCLILLVVLCVYALLDFVGCVVCVSISR